MPEWCCLNCGTHIRRIPPWDRYWWVWSERSFGPVPPSLAHRFYADLQGRPSFLRCAHCQAFQLAKLCYQNGLISTEQDDNTLVYYQGILHDYP